MDPQIFHLPQNHLILEIGLRKRSHPPYPRLYNTGFQSEDVGLPLYRSRDYVTLISLN
jgi:hypothetical protein